MAVGALGGRPAGERPARRLTRSAPGESSPVWAPDGSLLFTSARPDPDADGGRAIRSPRCGACPPSGGEARPRAHPARRRSPGSPSRRTPATSSSSAATMPGGSDAEADEERRKKRKDAGVTAILHEAYPVRYWDHDLGPAAPHLFWAGPLPAEEPADGGEPVRAARPHPGRRPAERRRRGLRALPRRPPAGPRRGGARRAGGTPAALVLTDTATGSPALLVDDPLADVYAAALLPRRRRRWSASGRRTSTYAEPPDYTLLLVDVRRAARRASSPPGFDRWPSAPQFSADGTAVYFLADDDGRHAIFRVPVDGGAPVRLTGDGAYSDLQVARDGSALYALRSAYDSPSVPVRLDPRGRAAGPARAAQPGHASAPCPARCARCRRPPPTGHAVQSWLVLPEGASAERPAPLLLWIHGGPLMSWNSWSWRWCPWVMAARGYAVLLPNPALSQGFGQDFVRRGWGEWGGAPYTDLMAAVDAAEQLPDIDASRTAAMGGSFGGYMANWVATQTDRFRAIVTHASLWDLDAFTGTTDAAYYWEKEWGDPLREPKRYEQNSPHRYADAIRTPMLVIHGDKDYRVPIGEALRLWYDLQKRGVPSKFLYFPDENHWVLTPGERDGLVRDGARLPGRARARRGVAAARAALTRRHRSAPRSASRPARASGSASVPRISARSSAGATQAASALRQQAGPAGSRGRCPAPG